MRRLRPRQPPSLPPRRAHAEPRPAAPPPPASTPATAGEPSRPGEPSRGGAERRVRAAGGPEDHATYACRCGAVFGATPTTSVSCPLCGIHQAW